MLLEKSLIAVFNKWKYNIRKDISRNNINRALKSLSFLCDLKQYLYTEYYDHDVEGFIETLSSQIFPNPSNDTANDANVAMMDSLARDNHGLTQQYLRAFMCMGLNILYVIIGGRYKYTQIVRELEEYGKAKIFIFDTEGDNNLEQLMDLYHAVVSFNAANIFTHSFSVIDPVLLKALPVPTKYRINLGDHHTWSGVSATDYIIEFRNWGATLSYQRRGISKEKIIMQPYYPVEDNVSFCGLPVVDENKVIIFSGGASYKIKDKDMTFLKLILRLLDENPQAVVFFACRDDDKLLKKFIMKNKLHDRFFLTGYRADLKAVFERIDIYLNTYPTGGGLMIQYAMKNRRPILNLKKDTIDYFEYDDNGIRYCNEYENIDDLCREAKILIQNKRHRENVGLALAKEILSETEFNHSVSKIISKKKTDYNFTEISFDYEFFRKNFQNQSFNKDASAQIAGLLYSIYSYKYLLKFPYPIVFYGTVMKLREKVWEKLYKKK